MMEEDDIVEQFVADFDDDGVSIPQLPPEMWKLILDNIKDPPTLVSCFNTCKSWRDLLGEKKSEFYFPLILPFLGKYLSNDELLECRQVCTSWMRTMDEHRQSEVPPWDHHRYFGRELLEAGNEAWNYQKLLGGNRFCDDSSPAEFLEAMEDHPGNPFPTRSVFVELWSAEAYSHFQRVLQQFGKEIRTLVFICRSNENNATAASQLQPIFNLCTNLVSLSLLMPDSWLGHDVRNRLRWMLGHPSQLPEIPTLVSLNIYGYGTGPVAEALLQKYGKQLQRLEVNQEILRDSLFFTNADAVSSPTGAQILPSLLLPNMSTLKVRHQGTVRLLQVLQTLVHCKFPSLERLSFCDTNSNNGKFRGGEPVSFRVLIRAINPFSASLVQLFLLFHKDQLRMLPAVIQDQDTRRNLAVQFPKLSTLGVSYSIMYTKSLEHLLKKFVALGELIFYDYSFQVDHGVLPGKREHFCKTRWREMLQKLEGFWELLPSLKRISVNRRISHAQNVFLLSRPQSQKDLTEQRERVVNALWDEV